MMIQVQHIEKYYGAELVLQDICFDIREGDKVGLIGRNGTGKTTMFRLLKGLDKPDRGEISIRKGAKIGYLAQVMHVHDESVYDVLSASFKQQLEWSAQMKKLEQLMSDPEQIGDEARFARLLQEYGQVQERFERAGGYEIDSQIERVANGLGIPTEQYTRPFPSLSGGEKTKVGLAALLLEQPDILLLDEPTNHLDMRAIEWLESFLRTYAGTVVVISHDRYFLDSVVTKIVEFEDGEAVTYVTNYSDYQVEKEARLLRQFAAFQEQQKKIKQMQETIKQLIDWGNRANPPNAGFHRRAASMQKALDRMTKLKRPIMERKAIELDLRQRDRSGSTVVSLDRVRKSYGERLLFEQVSDLLRYGERAILIGDNGSGKSTLLKMLLGQEFPDEGSVRLGSRVELGYLAQEAAPQDHHMTVLQYFRTELALEEGAARGQLARFLFYGADAFKQVRSLSGGEWSRLRLAVLMHRQPNLLLLDEPTNHLDIDSREALEEALEEYTGTMLAVSHDRYFINRLAHKIWALEQGKLNSYGGDFEYYKEKRPEQVELRPENRTAGGAGVLKQNKQATLLASEPAEQRQAPDLRQPYVKVNDKASTSTSATTNARTNTKDRSASSSATNMKVTTLERQIVELEQRLHQVDEKMLEPDCQSDAAKLGELYTEREQLQAELDAVYEQWMELTN
ncbi:ribosomal protection-like ABC-F family protein [Paenibacillus sp. 481]|uniref:ribosomal protection-like ABC-F family protein n=1 Tax=Paenibacillus sp. 481 TaxID=2835869 RepID=UPI001E5E2689|nr:ABC-F family ATP-binding cassette domain-containing protein [Paenibacillus sp. 481]UHA75527.1 ABC-F family ATP-binding cassette domain-containing protein [Paenibacillus sp. 481]